MNSMRNISIAIVDDDNDSRDFIRRMLIRYGAEKNTEFVVDGYENAVDFIEKYKAGYDLIFMDIMMPYMDGMTAAAKLRELDTNVLLVFITTMAQYAAQGYDVDAFGFLIKPVTYESIALKMAKAMERLESETGKRVSAQAVGGAVGHNPVSLIVPCHRVIGADGSLTGYAGGVEKKRALLRLEGASLTPDRSLFR